MGMAVAVIMAMIMTLCVAGMVIVMTGMMIVACHVYRSSEAAKSAPIVGASLVPSRRNST